jgi:hypothetical protein
LAHTDPRRAQNPGDVIRIHRDEHASDWLRGACQEAIATGDAEAVVQRFLRELPLPTP